LGSTLSQLRWVRGVGLLLLAFLVVGGPAHAVGIGVDVGLYTVDVTTALASLPTAAAAAVDAFEVGLLMSGVPELVVDDLIDDLDLALDTIEVTVGDLLAGTSGLLLSRLPIPALGGWLEFGLPLPVVNTVRVGVAWLTEAMVLDAITVFGIEAPELPYTVVADGIAIVVDPAFSTTWVSIEVAGRLGLLIAAIEGSVGIDRMWGVVLPGVSVAVPEFQSVADDALAALHLERIAWAATAVHAGVGVELGPPFLRLYARVQGLMPIVLSAGSWWRVTVATLAARVGVVLRF